MSRLITWRRLACVLAFLVSAVVLVAALWVIVAGPVTVYRVVRFGTTKIGDFLHYPASRLLASPAPFRLGRQAQPPPLTVTVADGAAVALKDLAAANDSIAFLVIKDDAIVFEEYFQGHTESSPSQVFSVSKSVTSVLIGAAIQDGLVQSVEQPVTDFIPELVGQGFDRVALRDLLTMTSGSSYIEDDNPFGIHVIMNYTPDIEEEVLRFKVNHEPGEQWRYKSGDNALLALVLRRVLAPRTIADYTQEKLWTPLGMEYDGVWSLDSEAKAFEKTWCCLAAAARDLAKIGRLYLRGGDWDGQRIVTEAWVRQSTQAGGVPEAGWPDDYRAIGLRNYGYQWWLASQEEGDYLAFGKDGQYLYVNPAKNVVIVRLGWSSGDMFTSGWLALFQQIANQV